MTNRPTIGIPYARAVVNDKGYAVQCPRCGHHSYGKGKTEATITKSAARAHADHWAEDHQGAN